MPKKRSLLSRIFSRSTSRDQRQTLVVERRVKSRYDAAQNTDDNRNHWSATDALSASSALSSDVRRKLRERSRYEVANNSFAKGLGLTIANDTIGTGPTLQLLDPVSRESKTLVETLFWEWAQEIRLPDILRTMRFARFDSGECFAQYVNNPSLDSPVKLDVEVIETEQIADPTFDQNAARDPNWDGIDYDQYGNPSSYRKLRVHPGANTFFQITQEYDDIPARDVWHYYRVDRPGQLRGIPDVTPALTLLPELRRFRDATIAAAETAADFAGVLETSAPANEDDAIGSEAESSDGSAVPRTWDLAEVTKRMLTVLPEGWKLSQLKSEHPSTTFEMFDNAIKREIARCLCVPFHIASLDPRDANMSSAYVVGQMYAHERKVDRSCFDYFLSELFARWLEEARLIRGFLPPLPDRVPTQFFWPSLGHHADPSKVANAAQVDLSTGRSNLPMEFAKQGLDWEEQQELAARSFGVSIDDYRELLRTKLFGPDPQALAQQQQQADDASQSDNSGDSNAQDNATNGHARALSRLQRS